MTRLLWQKNHDVRTKTDFQRRRLHAVGYTTGRRWIRKSRASGEEGCRLARPHTQRSSLWSRRRSGGEATGNSGPFYRVTRAFSTLASRRYSEAVRLLLPVCSYNFLVGGKLEVYEDDTILLSEVRKVGIVATIAWSKCRATSFLHLTRPSFSTAHRKRPFSLSHFEKTLKPGVPVLPVSRTSLEADRQ